MNDKKVTNCTTGEVIYESFTQEEIAQREYEASLPSVIPEPTEIEVLQAKNLALEDKALMNQGMIDFIIMNF